MNERPQSTGRFNSCFTILALCLGSCSGIKVESDRKAAPQLTSYETYAWSSEPPPPLAGGVDDDRGAVNVFGLVAGRRVGTPVAAVEAVEVGGARPGAFERRLVVAVVEAIEKARFPGER